MEGPKAPRGSFKAKTDAGIIIIMIVWVCIMVSVGDCMELPPLSFWPCQWELRDTVTGKVIASNTSSTVPCFLFDLCDLVGDSWGTLVTNYKQPMGFAPPVPENPYMVTYGCGHRDQEQKLANIPG